MATVKRSRTRKISETAEATPPSQASTVSVTTRSVDLHDAIRRRAYELYQQRGGQHGTDVEDWVRAEKEVLERFHGRVA